MTDTTGGRKRAKKSSPSVSTRSKSQSPVENLDYLDIARIDPVRNENIGRLLLLAFRIFESIMLKNFSAMGCQDLRMSHLPILRNIKAEGSRTTEIAEQTSLTKQAVGSLAHELEEMGYIRRFPDPTDGRAKLVRFSGHGMDFVHRLPEAIHNSEKEIAAIIGDKEFKTLRKALHHLIVDHSKSQR